MGEWLLFWRQCRARKRKFRARARDVGLTIPLRLEYREYGGRAFLEAFPTRGWTIEEYDLAVDVMKATWADAVDDAIGSND